MLQTFILILGGMVGAICSFLLQKHGFSTVISSCLVGLIGSITGTFFKSPQLSLVIFSGSFVGMTSSTLATVPIILFGGALSGIIDNISVNTTVRL